MLEDQTKTQPEASPLLADDWLQGRPPWEQFRVSEPALAQRSADRLHDHAEQLREAEHWQRRYDASPAQHQPTLPAPTEKQERAARRRARRRAAQRRAAAWMAAAPGEAFSVELTGEALDALSAEGHRISARALRRLVERLSPLLTPGMIVSAAEIGAAGALSVNVSVEAGKALAANGWAAPAGRGRWRWTPPAGEGTRFASEWTANLVLACPPAFTSPIRAALDGAAGGYWLTDRKRIAAAAGLDPASSRDLKLVSRALAWAQQHGILEVERTTDRRGYVSGLRVQAHPGIAAAAAALAEQHRRRLDTESSPQDRLDTDSYPQADTDSYPQADTDSYPAMRQTRSSYTDADTPAAPQATSSTRSTGPREVQMKKKGPGHCQVCGLALAKPWWNWCSAHYGQEAPTSPPPPYRTMSETVYDPDHDDRPPVTEDQRRSNLAALAAIRERLAP